MEENGIQTCIGRKKFLPVGTEQYNKYYDCMVVKVGDFHIDRSKSAKENTRLRNQNWALKQNVVWEKENGRKLKWREVVIFLDGDRMNYDPKNLYAVPMNIAGTVEKAQMHSEDPDIYKTALMWGELYYLLKGEKTWVKAYSKRTKDVSSAEKSSDSKSTMSLVALTGSGVTSLD